MPVTVLLDANIWYPDPLLKGPEGAALLCYLHDQQNFLALPEVVEREVEKNLNKRAEESAGMIDQQRRLQGNGADDSPTQSNLVGPRSHNNGHAWQEPRPVDRSPIRSKAVQTSDGGTPNITGRIANLKF